MVDAGYKGQSAKEKQNLFRNCERDGRAVARKLIWDFVEEASRAGYTLDHRSSSAFDDLKTYMHAQSVRTAKLEFRFGFSLFMNFWFFLVIIYLIAK